MGSLDERVSRKSDLSLAESDPELFALVAKEKRRQRSCLELIASENYSSKAVLEPLSTCLANIYSPGHPGHRSSRSSLLADQVELLCQKRALETFELDPSEWGVNVQPYSGSPANYVVYAALVEPHGRIMGLDVHDGGHPTHGCRTADKKVSAASLFFETMAYKLNAETDLIDYDQLAQTARLFQPRLIVAGTSCYTRHLNYERLRAIADENRCYLMGDMAHTSGMVAAKLVPAMASPFQFCDVITSTTHKTLRGVRSGIIFYRKGVRSVDENGVKAFYNFEEKIQKAVFPGLQDSAHINAIAGVAVALKHAASPQFHNYQKQILKNAQVLDKGLQNKGYVSVTGGTDNHQVWLDLRPTGVDGYTVERLLETASISCNKHAVPGDTNSVYGGIRVGTPPLTSRGLVEKDMEQVVELLHRGIGLAVDLRLGSNPTMSQFDEALAKNEDVKNRLQNFKTDVENFASQFFLPGFEEY